MKISPLFLSSLLFLQACAPQLVSNQPEVRYTAYSENKMASKEVKPIFLHLVDEPTLFEYTKIGSVELLGNQEDSVVLENMRYQAWLKGGNAVLFIKKEIVIDTQNRITPIMDGSFNSSSFQVNKWTGVVADIPQSVYEMKKAELSKSNFVKLVEKDQEEQHLYSNSLERSGKIMGIVILGGFVVWLISLKD